MEPGPLDRIAREAGVDDLAGILAERLAPTDLQSLLLEVYRRRAKATSPSRALERYETDRFVRPSAVDPDRVAALDRLAFSLLPEGFERMELSPVAPLGSVGALTNVDQNWLVSTVRNTEVVGDSTNVLALECASRRRRDRGSRVRLAASHRLVRGQPLSDPAFRPHFRLLALCTAGRDEGAFAFELEALREHVGFYLRLLAAVGEIGLRATDPRVTITDLSGGERAALLEEHVLGPLAVEVPVAFDPERTAGRGYYAEACFAVHVTNPSGREFALVDGGLTTWTEQLLSDRKERLLTSGIGTELLCSLFVG
jgi:hypothetical protein